MNGTSNAVPVVSVGLQLLDPNADTGDAETGFLADIRRWIDIFVGEYQTFLPLIAMFAAIGMMALTYAVRRRLPVAKAAVRSGAPPKNDLRFTARGATVTSTVTSRPFGAERSRFRSGPLPPSARH